MYFAQIFKYDKPGDVVWEGPIDNEDLMYDKLTALEHMLDIPLDLEYWLITGDELRAWKKKYTDEIHRYLERNK